jgi:hypothetical protein
MLNKRGGTSFMKQGEVFGSIMHNGTMVNLDKESIEKLEKISSELKEKYDALEKKSKTIFNQ